jgi:hypothetical protein
MGVKRALTMGRVFIGEWEMKFDIYIYIYIYYIFRNFWSSNNKKGYF